MAEWVEKELTVLVKTYPNLSKKYEELVCVAGVDNEGNWVRIYPVPYRDLESSQKFKPFQKISVKSRRKLKDKRPESYEIQFDTIELVGKELKTTGKDLYLRSELIRKGIVGTMCDLNLQRLPVSNSLSVIKPRKLIRFWHELSTGEDKWDEETKLRATQNSFFNPDRLPLEEPKYTFKYEYLCEDPECKGHKQTVKSWEIQQTYRKWRNLYTSEAKALELIGKRWGEEMWLPGKDTHLYVGSRSDYHNKFMIVGNYWSRDPSVGNKDPRQQQLL